MKLQSTGDENRKQQRKKMVTPEPHDAADDWRMK